MTKAEKRRKLLQERREAKQEFKGYAKEADALARDGQHIASGESQKLADKAKAAQLKAEAGLGALSASR